MVGAEVQGLRFDVIGTAHRTELLAECDLVGGFASEPAFDEIQDDMRKGVAADTGEPGVVDLEQAE